MYKLLQSLCKTKYVFILLKQDFWFEISICFKSFDAEITFFFPISLCVSNKSLENFR